VPLEDLSLEGHHCGVQRFRFSFILFHFRGNVGETLDTHRQTLAFILVALCGKKVPLLFNFCPQGI